MIVPLFLARKKLWQFTDVSDKSSPEVKQMAIA